jgi:hypothetical protein
MGFRFQRRIRIVTGLGLNLSRSGTGFSAGRTGFRIGMDAKRRKYFSAGLPGTGLSYRTLFGPPVPTRALKNAAYAAIAAALCFVVIVVLMNEKG